MFSLIPFFGVWNWNCRFYVELVFRVERCYEKRFEWWKINKRGIVIRAEGREGLQKISKINKRWGGGRVSDW